MICPRCGNSEITDNQPCPSCGWKQEANDGGDAIERMLEAAKSRIDTDIPPVMGIDSDELEKAFADSEAEAEAPQGEPLTVGDAVVGRNDKDISAEQINAFMSGDTIAFIPGQDDPIPLSNPNEIVSPMDSERIMAVTEKAAAALQSNTAPSAEKMAIDNDFASFMPDFEEDLADINIDDAPIPQEILDAEAAKNAKKKPNIVIYILTFVFAFLIAAVVMGITVFLVFFTRFYAGDVENGYGAVKLVVEDSKASGQVYVDHAYKKSTSIEDQYMLFLRFENALGETEDRLYRVVYEKKDAENPKIYRPLDITEYETLKNGTGEEKVTASLLKSYDDTTKKAKNDILASSKNWVELDCAAVNMRLAMEDGIWFKTETPVVTSEASEEYEEDTLEDIPDLPDDSE